MTNKIEEVKMITITYNHIKMKFETSNDVFSPNDIDKGTKAMLSLVELKNCDKILDLGCGYGFVGIYCAKIIRPSNIWMTDIQNEAINLTRKNILLNHVEGVNLIKSDGFKTIDEKDFTLILSNPPYHVNFSIPKHFIEKGFNRLAIGGKMMMVTKRKTWYKNKLISIFGGVIIKEIDEYYVFIAEKRQQKYAKK